MVGFFIGNIFCKKRRTESSQEQIVISCIQNAIKMRFGGRQKDMGSFCFNHIIINNNHFNHFIHFSNHFIIIDMGFKKCGLR